MKHFISTIMRGGIMSLEDMDAREFMKMVYDFCYNETDDYDLSEEWLLETIISEMKKKKRERDYSLIHECYLTLNEVYGYPYNNDYEELAEKQINRVKKINAIKEKFSQIKTAML